MRTVTDEDGRVWSCNVDAGQRKTPIGGHDVVLLCTTPSVKEAVRFTIGWQWMKMAEKGLARLIAAALP